MTIHKIYIDRDVSEYPLIAGICERLKLPAETVSSHRQVFAAVSATADPISAGKQVLFLTRNRGAFVKNCPGTRQYLCCGYQILHIGTYCSMDCSYCIMQSYFHPPVLQFFVNHQDLLAELDTLFARDTISRIGTGEFTDSLIWDIWTELSVDLVPAFARQQRAVLELKTKTTSVDKLKALDHNRKTIVAWSLNTARVIRDEERGTASLQARIRAAARCQRWGYPLAFHFDPMVLYENCEEDYREAVALLFDQVSPDNIAWISLGAFRFMPALKGIIQKRFPKSKIVYGEFVPGLDGKLRYFKPLRIGLFRKMASWIREVSPAVPIYFCMEDDEVWRKALGFTPAEKGGLDRMLDESAARLCGVNPKAG
jgi:spore photoproduct lyase